MERNPSSSITRYCHVQSWILDFNGQEIDVRSHGFIVPIGITYNRRIKSISDALGMRMWCDVDGDYISQEDFDLHEFDSITTIS